MSTRNFNSFHVTLKALGKVLVHVNENMPVHSYEGFDWRRENFEGRACVEVADIPEEFWSAKALGQGFPQKISVQALRFGEGDFVSLHRHKAASSSMLIPGKKRDICSLLEIEMFGEGKPSVGPKFRKRAVPHKIRPRVWHRITRVGEGDYAYVIYSASAPIIGNDIEWHADQ